MKKILTLLLGLCFTAVLLGQTNYKGLFHGKVRTSPEIYADGIFSFFIKSDNQLRYGNTEQAILLLDNAIAQNPFFTEAYIKRSNLLAGLGRQNEARKVLDLAYKLNPYLSKFFRTRKLGRLEYIALDTQKVQVVSADNTILADALKNSIQKKQNGKFEEALQDLGLIIDALEEPEAALFNLRGSLHLLLDDYQEAVNSYTKAIQLEPQSAEYYFNRGLAQLFTYDRSAACEDLEMSKQLGYEESEVKLKNFCFY